VTDWEPATEAEAVLRDALRTGDQERYFQILSRIDLLLPVSQDVLAGRAQVGWGTWTTGGRTHILAFTSAEAMAACLAEHAGSARRVPYQDLAAAWPNEDWWLAINPGLPIEGYLPAWFVTQLSRGDIRLPGRTIGARARVEAAAAARARGAAVVPPLPAAAIGGRRALPTPPVPPQPGAHHAPDTGLSQPSTGLSRQERLSRADPGFGRSDTAGRARVPAHAAPDPQPEREPRKLTVIPPRAVPPRGQTPSDTGTASGSRPAALPASPPEPPPAGLTRLPEPSGLSQPPAAAPPLRPHELLRPRETAQPDTERPSGWGRATGPVVPLAPPPLPSIPARPARDLPAPAREPVSRDLPTRPIPRSSDAGGPIARAADPARLLNRPTDPGEPAGRGETWRESAGLVRPAAAEPAVSKPSRFFDGESTEPLPSSGREPLAPASREPLPTGGREPLPTTSHDLLPTIGHEPLPTTGRRPAVALPARPDRDSDSDATWPKVSHTEPIWTRDTRVISGWPEAEATPPVRRDAGRVESEPAEPSPEPPPVESVTSEPASEPDAATAKTTESAIDVDPDFEPANDVESELLAAAGGGQTDQFLSTLLLAKVLIPIPAGTSTNIKPGEVGFIWRREQVEGQPYVVVFTSEERINEYLGLGVDTVSVKFVQLIAAWPDETWSFAVNPGTPVGATLPGVQIKALATWATEVGLTDQPSVEYEEASAIAVGTAVVPANRPVVMQKPIAPSQISYYLERGYDRVSGFVQRAGEVAHLTTPEQLYQALGLGYAGSPFKQSDEEVYVLRWTAHRPNLYRIPFGGRDEHGMQAMQGWVIERAPFRGNGFAPGESGEVIAEFKVDSARLPHAAQLWRMTRDAGETLVAMLDSDVPRWRRVDGEDGEPAVDS